MSSILKALRKLEQEKARRNEGQVDIARDILRSAQRKRRAFPWPLLLGFCLLLGVGCVGAWHLFGPEPPSAAPVLHRSEPVTPQGRAGSPPETVSREVGAVRTLPAVTAPSEPEVVEVKIEDLRPASAVVPSAPSRTEPVPSVEPTVATEGVAPIPAQIVTRVPVVPDENVQATAARAAAESLPEVEPSEGSHASGLVISGIAFGENPLARLAVVNGLPVMEGTVVEGAKVLEILPDRVRFVSGEGEFEVSMDGKGVRR
ncbi:MAG: hypothetical protein C0617_01975 [Desulfuromonas sp.]|uniref:hypothetical protein n=1 Tax=Desulfuromonas sp. TaxID=892 RepID=UPI000CA94A47|nr:hypothetical protein [Desulfuromonas sp.]PLX86150.1 MAG: hypothetical protein C0617_01975 [Desulfuromonas sp.]